MTNLEEAVFFIDLHCCERIPRIQTGGANLELDVANEDIHQSKLKHVLQKAAQFFHTKKDIPYSESELETIINEVLNRNNSAHHVIIEDIDKDEGLNNIFKTIYNSMNPTRK